MRFFLLSLLSLIFLTTPTYAIHPNDGHIHDITVKVNGLVCDFCALAMEKVIGKRAEVEDIGINLDDHVVTIDLKDNANIDDEELTRLINDSGYSVEEIIRH